MGVPVITLRAPPEGAIHAQNVGASLLSCVGLSDLAADTADDYVTAARRLAADTSRLASLRETLRKDFLASPLADTNAYQRKAEDMFQVRLSLHQVDYSVGFPLASARVVNQRGMEQR